MDHGRRALAALLPIAVAAACSSDREPVSAPPFGDGTIEVPPASGPPLTASAVDGAIPVDSVAMVGDSITVGSRDALQEGLDALGLDDIEIDAAGGRRIIVDGGIGSGLAAVTDLAQSETPDLWVIALGTNDVANYQTDEYAAAIDELLAALPPDAPLVWVDTYLEGFPEQSARFNDVLRYVLTARGRATIVEWSAIAGQDGVLSDGVHPSGFGVLEFSDRVVTAVDDWMA